MIPKEKAVELINKFIQIESGNIIDYNIAIKCANIVVSEIIELSTWIDESFVKDYPLIYSREDTYEFWAEVYQELGEL